MDMRQLKLCVMDNVYASEKWRTELTGSFDVECLVILMAVHRSCFLELEDVTVCYIVCQLSIMC